MGFWICVGIFILDFLTPTLQRISEHHNGLRKMEFSASVVLDPQKWTVQMQMGLREDPEVYYNMSQLITSQGYPCEIYDVVTADGFILRLYRIPHGRNGTISTDKPVVLLQHGLLASSTNWVTNLPSESLGFLMADAGFDVWMGNSRGNKYSLRHKKYTPREDEFWDFSWDEMARYDLPAVMEKIEHMTGKNEMYYAGHSQGTLQAFALFSKNQELASKIKMFFALAPVVTVGHLEGPIKYFSHVPDEILLDIFGRRDFLPNNEIIDFLADTLCKDRLTRFVCYDIVFLLCGFDLSNLNQSRLPVYMSHTPAGTSTKDMIHFSQMKRTNAFQMYNYDSKKQNIEHYGQETPPLYNVTAMEVPIVLFSGGHDWLADPTDVADLIPKLQNIKAHISIPKYEHLDFIWGIDAHKLVYHPIIQMIKDDMKTSS